MFRPWSASPGPCESYDEEPKNKKRSRFCKAKRDQYRRLVERLVEMLREDPAGFSLESVRLPHSIDCSEESRARVWALGALGLGPRLLFLACRACGSRRSVPAPSMDARKKRALRSIPLSPSERPDFRARTFARPALRASGRLPHPPPLPRSPPP